MNEVVFAGAVIVIAVAMLFMKLSSLERRLNRLSRLDAKVDALLKHAGVVFNEFQDVPAEVVEALERGENILAIKRFREATGVDLKEAKEFIDKVRQRMTPAR